jgi:hypothetical protein
MISFFMDMGERSTGKGEKPMSAYKKKDTKYPIIVIDPMIKTNALIGVRYLASFGSL